MALREGKTGLLYEVVLLEEVVHVLSPEKDLVFEFNVRETLPHKVLQDAAADL